MIFFAGDFVRPKLQGTDTQYEKQLLKRPAEVPFVFLLLKRTSLFSPSSSTTASPSSSLSSSPSHHHHHHQQFRIGEVTVEETCSSAVQCPTDKRWYHSTSDDKSRFAPSIVTTIVIVIIIIVIIIIKNLNQNLKLAMSFRCTAMQPLAVFDFTPRARKISVTVS